MKFRLEGFIANDHLRQQTLNRVLLQSDRAVNVANAYITLILAQKSIWNDSFHFYWSFKPLTIIHLSLLDTKGQKDSFMKKIEKVSKTYDYKNENIDVQAKVSYWLRLDYLKWEEVAVVFTRIEVNITFNHPVKLYNNRLQAKLYFLSRFYANEKWANLVSSIMRHYKNIITSVWYWILKLTKICSFL